MYLSLLWKVGMGRPGASQPILLDESAQRPYLRKDRWDLKEHHQWLISGLECGGARVHTHTHTGNSIKRWVPFPLTRKQ